MAAVRILVDPDVFIDYFNAGDYAGVLDDRQTTIYYSVVTRKELLGKPGLKDRERQAIIDALRRFRLVPLSAATALDKRLPLMTRNWRHFRRVPGLTLYSGR